MSALTSFPIFIKGMYFHILQKYRVAHENLRKAYIREGYNVVFVHDLIRCPYKPLLEATFKGPDAADLLKSSVIVGELIHEALRAMFPEWEAEPKEKELEVDGKKYIVLGQADLYNYDDDTVIEVKFSRSFKGLPRPQNDLQIAIYKWLYDAANGELWYLTPDGFKAFRPSFGVDDHYIRELIKDKKKPKWPKWECDYCIFRDICEHSLAR